MKTAIASLTTKHKQILSALEKAENRTPWGREIHRIVNNPDPEEIDLLVECLREQNSLSPNGMKKILGEGYSKIIN